MIGFDAGVYTDCGRYRAINEDSFMLCGRATPDGVREGAYGLRSSRREFGVAAVFDGMGGAKHGDLASSAAAGLLCGYMEDILNLGRAGVDLFVTDANSAVCEKSRELGAPMGSTMTLISVSDESASVFNIGDSRAYIVRSGQIKQLTKDHTVAASLGSMGIENKSKSQKHQLTQYLGIPPEEIVIQAFSFGSFKLKDGDKVLLCSDGVTDGLSDKQLAALLSQDKPALELSKDIVKAAAHFGSRDNITAMVLCFKDNGVPAKRYNRAGEKVKPAQVSNKNASVKRDRAEGLAEFLAAAPAGRAPVERPGAASPRADAPVAGGKDKLALFWLLNFSLAVVLGFVLGVIYSII